MRLLKTKFLADLCRDLEQIEVLKKEDWSDMDVWIGKAKPIIRTHFADFLSDFEDIAKQPRWKNPTYSSSGYNSMTGETWGTPVIYHHSENSQIAIKAKSKIVNFLNSILTLQYNNLDEPNDNEVDENMPLSNKFQRIKNLIKEVEALGKPESLF